MVWRPSLTGKLVAKRGKKALVSPRACGYDHPRLLIDAGCTASNKASSIKVLDAPQALKREIKA
jgi:hypothetical protein